MNNKNSEHERLNEFAEFVETDPVSPSKNRDDAVLNMVTRDLCPAPLNVFSKFTLIEAATGLLTLTICPQFGLGVGRHNEFLHSLHTMTTPVVFYLFCGLFFVLLGAGLSGLVLSRTEIRTIGNLKFVYFALFSVLAYLILVVLGPEVFVLSSLVWILGAFGGNVLGFEVVIWLRRRILGPKLING